MSIRLAQLANELHLMGRGQVILCDPHAKELQLLVHVDGVLAQRFVDEMRSAKRIAMSCDTGWPDERYVTPTEVALQLLGNITPEQLSHDLALVGVRIEVLEGNFYLDGHELQVTLVDHARELFVDVAGLTQTADDGTTYPLFEAFELVVSDRSLVLAAPQ